MSSNKDQPAFPAEVSHSGGEMLDKNQTGMNTAIYKGLSKREYMATMAMQGLASTHSKMEQYSVNVGCVDVEEIAKESVALADALLAELEKTNP
jgi:hypothetical protein